MPEDVIVDVGVATVAGQIPEPIRFGDWIIEHREFVVVRLRSANGLEGWSFTLTRDGAVAEQIRKSLEPIYRGAPVGGQEAVFRTAWRRSLPSHSAGVGLRALSLLDLAAWDLAAKASQLSIASLLGGTHHPMPATAIIGYPPGAMGPRELAAQVKQLLEAGWNRFKLAVSATPEATINRLQAVRDVAPESWLGLDGAWTFESVAEAVEFALALKPLNLGWFEDVFPPGDASMVRELRRAAPMPIAMGDEQGGSYYPDALIDADAVDVVRIDLTCMGGITRGREIIRQCVRAGRAFSTHMNAHVHSQVLAALGHIDCPIEWGVPWTGVDPYADSLRQPTILKGGLMAPLPEEPGFGPLVNLDWVLSQPTSDPDGIFEGV